MAHDLRAKQSRDIRLTLDPVYLSRSPVQKISADCIGRDLKADGLAMSPNSPGKLLETGGRLNAQV
ncbi:hypothetical protein SDC9_126730 [bioreactor metagenome]|uniref:Uncharacterized protein n=1 Tax=bioreactor metagenome TaxID=1076179 RepID=A0A645CS06_9ZZZZ